MILKRYCDVTSPPPQKCCQTYNKNYTFNLDLKLLRGTVVMVIVIIDKGGICLITIPVILVTSLSSRKKKLHGFYFDVDAKQIATLTFAFTAFLFAFYLLSIWLFLAILQCPEMPSVHILVCWVQAVWSIYCYKAYLAASFMCLVTHKECWFGLFLLVIMICGVKFNANCHNFAFSFSYPLPVPYSILYPVHPTLCGDVYHVRVYFYDWWPTIVLIKHAGMHRITVLSLY